MFGQYSRGSTRHTKADQVSYAVQQGLDVASAKRAGHNRLEFTLVDGTRCFMLHQTVIASLSPKGLLTLDDGGWATMTTRRAMADALTSWGLPSYVGSGSGGNLSYRGRRFDRKATFDPDGNLVGADSAPYLIRASTVDSAYGEREVTWDGRTLRSTELGVAIPLTPVKAVSLLRRIAEEVRKAKRGDCPAVSPISSYRRATAGFRVLGFDVAVEQFGTIVYFGCHVFEALDISAIRRRIEADYPAAAAKLKKDGSMKPPRKADRRSLKASAPTALGVTTASPL